MEEQIAVIILNYNAAEMTIKIIENFERIDINRKLSLVVVDNDSGDECKQKLFDNSNNDSRYHLILNSKNGGYAVGNNIGLRWAYLKGFRFALVTNNDIEIENFDVLIKMLDLILKNDTIAAVSPRIIGKDGKRDPVIYYKKPSFWDLSMGIVGDKKRRYAFNEHIETRIYAPRGSFMLLKLEMINKVDYLDENTFLYYEEPILAERLKEIYGECWLCGTTSVVHNHGKTITKFINKRKTFDIMSNSLRYYLKKYRNMNKIKIAICVFFRRMSYFRR